MTHVAFTGTKRGMTDAQRRRFRDVFAGLTPTWLHHGDCIGADAQAHEDALRAGVLVHLYPSTSRTRAWCQGATFMAAPLPPLERNPHIVLAGELVIATPGQMVEELRSGTWSAIRYARRIRKPVHIIWPDGQYVPPFPAR